MQLLVQVHLIAQHFVTSVETFTVNTEGMRERERERDVGIGGKDIVKFITRRFSIVYGVYVAIETDTTSNAMEF